MIMDNYHIALRDLAYDDFSDVLVMKRVAICYEMYSTRVHNESPKKRDASYYFFKLTTMIKAQRFMNNIAIIRGFTPCRILHCRCAVKSGISFYKE